jgi:hypothetical protein
MGVIGLGLGLIAATLPRLRSIEIQGIKLGLSDQAEQQVTEQGAQAGAKVAKAAIHALPAEAATDTELLERFSTFTLARAFAEGGEVPVLEIPLLDADEVAQWTHRAIVETTRRARAKQLEAALAGADPTEARLSEDEVDAIVERTRPIGG